MSSPIFCIVVILTTICWLDARMEIDRDALISAAINEVNGEVIAMKKEKSSTSQSKLHAFKKPTPETLAQGLANLKFENMVKLAEKKILRTQRLAVTQTKSSLAESLAQELFNTPGSVLSEKEVARIYKESGCPNTVRVPSACTGTDHHSPDGTCNNLENPSWGAAATPLRRLLPAQYEDGVSRARGFLQSQGLTPQGPFSSPSPSPRIVSTSVIKDTNREDSAHSHLLMQWGQFTDHDITAVPEHEACPTDTCKVSSNIEGDCYPFPVPVQDTEVEVTLANSVKCHAFRRSLGACSSSSQAVSPRQQLNSITHFIDGSNVYGYSARTLGMIRDLSSDAGLLRVGSPAEVGSQRPLLPDAAANSFITCPEGAGTCFLAGDTRCNEQSALTVMHTVWVREHNRIARYIKDHNPTLASDAIFQAARRIVVSQLQKITYKDYLPLILGDKLSSLVPNYLGYNPRINPSIPNAFATAAYRFGHSQIRTSFDRFDENYVPSPAGPLPLVYAFFNTSHVRRYGTDSILRGELSKPMMDVDEYLNSVLTSRLFADDSNTPGMDLAALNIQRGRDHGLSNYVRWKQWAKRECGIESEFRRKITESHLLNIYGNIDNVDLFVGGLAEEHLPNAKVGATFACIIAKTFLGLRDGDRFFYENTASEANPLSAEQRRELDKVSLSRVICDNTDIKKIQRNAFSNGEPRVSCSEIPSVNLDLWIVRPPTIPTTPTAPPSEPLPETCFIKVRTSQANTYFAYSRRVGEYFRDYSRESISAGSEVCLEIQCPKDGGEIIFSVDAIQQSTCAPRVSSYLPSSLGEVPNNVLPVDPTPSTYVQQFGASQFVQGNNGLFTSYLVCVNSNSIALDYNCRELASKTNADTNSLLEELAKINANDGGESKTISMAKSSLLKKEEKLLNLVEETLEQIKNLEKETVASERVEETNEDGRLASQLQKILERLN